MMPGWQEHQRQRRRLRLAVLGLILGAFALPLVWTMLASFGVIPDDASTPPTWATPSIGHYVEIGVAEPAFYQAMATSTGLAVSATLLTLLIALPAAYSLSRSRFRGQRVLLQGLLVLASLPVMAYIIPLGETVHRLQLEDTFAGVMLAQTAVYAPLAVYILSGYLARVPLALEEAAWLEGANAIQILRSVVLPGIAPGMAATAIILFVLHWNLLLVPLALSTSRVKTIPVLMSDFFTFERELEWPTAAAALVVSLFPSLVLVTGAYRLLERFQLHPALQTED